MAGASDVKGITEYWGRDGLGQAILDGLVAAGNDLDTLTVDDLAPFDQFHSGGKRATERLARVAELTPGARVLDVGGGLGGPARTLAVRFGCRVTLVDPTESYVRTSELLTARLGLGERVTHRVASGLELPFEDASFDVVWTQNSGMNIADKERLYEGFYRVLRPGGRLAIQEPMAGPVQPLIFPVMWARDATSSFLRSPEEMRAVIVAAGFRVRAWDDVTAELAGPRVGGPAPTPTIQTIVMGETLAAINAASQRDVDEGRLVSVHAVFDRT